MSEPEALALLTSMHAFRSLSEEELTTLAEQLTLHQFEDGDALMRQGTRADAIYILLHGHVNLYREELDQPDRHLAVLQKGDLFGEREILNPQPRSAGAEAIGSVTVLRWNRAAATLFLDNHPAVRASLQLPLSGRDLAEQLQPEWLGKSETIHALSRRHPIILVQKLILPGTLALAALLFPLLVSTGASIVFWLPLLLLVIAALLGVWQFLDWRNDYCFITNRRAICSEKIIGLYDSQQEAPLSMVLSFSVSTSFLGRIFNYGDIIIRTYTGKLSFLNLPHPELLVQILEEQWQRIQQREEDADRELLHETLEQRLRPGNAGEGEAEPLPPIEEDPTPPQRAAQRWSLKVRVEEDGVITYRKHWAVLLQDLMLPTLLILAALSLWLSHLFGWFAILTTQGAGLLAAGILVPLIAFWWYRFVDWSNDIYQITPTQIIDIYKRPLARELRKVAPIANILGTEVDRRGVFGVALNFGDVIANVGTEEFTFEGVFNPAVVQQDIVHAQEALLQRQHELERQQRRDEMVELIDIYHEKYAPRTSDTQKDKADDRTNRRNPAQ